MTNRKTRQRGFIYISALLMMLILLTLTVGYLTVVRTSVAISDNEMDLVRSIYTTEAGVEHVLADLKNGGFGTVMGDLDQQGGTDYLTSGINWDTNTFRVDKVASEAMPGHRTQYVEVEPGQFSGAIQVGVNITASTANSGTMNGDVDAIGSIDIAGFIFPEGYGFTPYSSQIAIPTLEWADYQTIANYSSCAGLQTPTPLPGIYYITGNCTISGLSHYNLNGTIVTTGSLMISSNPGSFTITPSGNYPAIISNSMTITSTENLNLNGLVYAANNANLSNWGGTNNVINGALVVGGTLDMQWVTNLTINFNPDLDPPSFAGGRGGPVTLKSFVANQL